MLASAEIRKEDEEEEEEEEGDKSKQKTCVPSKMTPPPGRVCSCTVLCMPIALVSRSRIFNTPLKFEARPKLEQHCYIKPVKGLFTTWPVHVCLPLQTCVTK